MDIDPCHMSVNHCSSFNNHLLVLLSFSSKAEQKESVERLEVSEPGGGLSQSSQKKPHPLSKILQGWLIRTS